MEITIKTLEEFNSFSKENAGAVFYFSTPDCNVCKVLKPKLKEFLAEQFAEMKFAYVNVADSLELAGQLSIFTVPTILFYLDGKEFIRKSRNINMVELENELTRPYELFFA